MAGTKHGTNVMKSQRTTADLHNQGMNPIIRTKSAVAYRSKAVEGTRNQIGKPKRGSFTPFGDQ